MDTINCGYALLGAGLGAGLVAIGCSLGIGKIGSAAAEAMARQPDAAGDIQKSAIVTCALIEGASLLGMIVCLLIATK